MSKKLIACVAFMAFLAGVAWAVAEANARVSESQPPAKKTATGMTVISVEDMDCPSCAKRVVGKVKEVSGVANAEADVKTSQLKVTAREGSRPSPKAMWEAVEKAGFKPTKLEGPAGNFTAKPSE